MFLWQHLGCCDWYFSNEENLFDMLVINCFQANWVSICGTEGEFHLFCSEFYVIAFQSPSRGHAQGKDVEKSYF